MDDNPAAGCCANEPDPAGEPCGLGEVLARTTAAALTVSGAEPGRVFEDLALGLSRVLGTDAALIAEFVDDCKNRMRTLALAFQGRLLRNVEYDVSQTPCRHIVGRASRFVPQGVNAEFGPGTLFSAQGFDAYAGYSILNAAGEQLGIIVALNRKPIANQQLTEALLKIFAVRAAAEIERQRAEAALTASETSYRAIFDSAEDAIFVHDWDTGAVVDVNTAACRIYGWPRAEMLAIGIDDVSSNIPPYTAETAVRYIDAAKRGEVVRFEWHRRNRDGSLHWDEVVLKAAMIGGVQRVLAFTREISDRKRAEEALRASEEQYRAIFNASADALVLWDSQYRRVDVNLAYQQMYGWSREEVIGRSYEHPQFTAEYAGPRLDLVRRALAGESCTAELTAIRKDGTTILTEVHAIPFRHRGEPHVLASARDITERKQAEQALRASEEQYRAIFEAATDALQLLDDQHRAVDVNPAYERMYGRHREEVIGKTVDELVPAPLREERRNLVAQALAGEAAELQSVGYRSDGTAFDLEIRVIPFRHRGQPHVLGIARDITERRRTEEALRASEEQYRAIFNASADALMLWNSRIQRIDVNPAHEKIFGFTREEVVGRGFEDLPYPEEYARPRIEMVRRALGGEPSEAELEAIRKDGRHIITELRTIPFSQRGERQVLQIARDVTEARMTDARLRASEEQYRSIFNASADAMLLRDDAMMIVDANPAFLALCGLPRDEVVGKARAPFVVEGFEAAAEQLLRAALAGVRGTLEAQTRTHDGALLDVEVRAMPMLYRGRPHVLAIARNITADKRAEAERERFEARLRQAQKMEAIGQLTGGIAHDFNNILASVMGYVVLAEERVADAGDDRTVEYLGQALGSCRRARDLIQQMLTFSRGGRGEPRALSLAGVVRDALPMLRSALPSTLAIDLDDDASAPAVWIDEVQAHQILLNLVINARDAMPGGGALRIGVASSHVHEAVCASCRSAVQGSFVELRVADSGHGIEPKLLERIFDPFFTTKAPGKGTGMGLSMVHGIVHEHHGHVLVDSEPGQGCTFRILLPAQAESPAVSALPRPRRAGRSPLAGRVLLVDDEPSVLTVMRETLIGWGLQVEACASVDAAERAFAQQPEAFDLLITDHAMPMATGIELAERLRTQRPDLRWLLCTGFADPGSHARALALGALAVLRKPIEREELSRVLEAALAQPVSAAAHVGAGRV